MTAAALQFDPASHVYRKGDRVLPSVTQVLKEAGLIDDSWFTPESAELGTVVHECCAILNRGLELDDDTVDDAARPSVDGYRKFLDDMCRRLEIDLIEHQCIDERFGYAGMLDIAGVFDGRSAVIDIKNGAPAPWHALQLAGYAATMPVPHERYAVYLDDCGHYSIKHYTDPSDKTALLSAVALVNWKRRFMR